MTRTLRKFGSVALVLVVLFVFGGAFPLIAGGDQEESDVTEVEIWFGREGLVPADEFETFHEENPDIRVEYSVVPLEEAHENFLRRLEAGSAPDVVQIFSEFMGTLVAQNAVQDISEYISRWEEEDPEDFNDLFEIATSATTFNGKTYGINVDTPPFFLVYRADWLEEAGLDPPKTWDDLMEAARVLQNDYLTGEQYAFAHPGGTHHAPRWMMGTAGGFGIEFSETGLPLVDSEGGVALIEFYQTLAKEGLQHPDSHTWASGDHRGAFIGGRAAFVPEQIHTLSVFEEEGLEWPDEFAAIKFPYLEGNKENYYIGAFGCPMMVSKQAEDLEAVYKVLRYVTNFENMLDVTMRYTPMPRKSVMTSDDYLNKNPWYPSVEETFEKGEILPSHPRSMEVNDILNRMKVAAQTELERSPKDIAEEYQAMLNKLED